MANRSAERGPTPGSLLSAAISSTIGCGREGKRSVGASSVGARERLHQTRNAQAGSEFAHFTVRDFFGLSQRLIDSGEDQVFEHRNVAGIGGLRIDLDGGHGAVAASHDFYRAATATGFDGAGSQLGLDFLHL